MTSEDTDSITGLQELQAGPSPCDSQAGQQIDLFGQPLVPVSRGPRRAREKEKRTNDICGQHFFPSSASVALTASLGNRLQQMLDTAGSMEYALTWKRRATPSGLRVFRLLARGHRTSASASSGLPLLGYPTPEAGIFGMADVERLLARRRECKERTGNGNGFGLTLGQMVPLMFGYPTCEASDATGGRVSKEIGGTRPSGAKRAITLGTVASLFGYTTPRACDEKGAISETETTARSPASGQANLPEQVLTLFGYATPRAPDHSTGAKETETTARRTASGQAKLAEQAVTLFGWATATASDHPQGGSTQGNRKSPNLSIQAHACQFFGPGTDSESSTVGTGNYGASLNPYFSAWLLGFPPEWLDCLPVQATRSRQESPGETELSEDSETR